MIQKLRQWFQTEKEKLRPMTWRQRGEYIWMYYSWGILITAAVVVMAVSLAGTVRQNSKDTLISGMFINTAVSEAGYDHLEKDYWAYWGSDPKQKADLVRSRFVTYDGGDPYASETISVVEAMVIAGSLDYIILDRETLDFLDRQTIAMDLRNLLPAEQLDRFETVETENGVVGLKLNETAFAKSYDLVPEPAYLMVIVNAPKPDRVAAFAEYLLGE